jgi:2-keto-3-deoxy-L-rhamnonate aldolase RhmA
MKNIKARIKKGEAVNGCWLNLGNATTAEIVASAGFDWVLIDLEHGAGDEQLVLSQLQAIEHSNAAAFVRVESNGRQRIHRVLDFGSEGIMCPHINDGSEAKAMVEGLRYPPHGSRGVAKMVRATQFGKEFAGYYQNANETIVGLAQVESKEALNNLDAIAAVDGIDVLFIGPADLTMDLGIFGEFDNPVFIDAVKATVAAAQKAQKATGILLFNPDDYQKYFNLGIRVIACGSDSGFVVAGSKNVADKLDAMRKNLTK